MQELVTEGFRREFSGIDRGQRKGALVERKP